MSYILGVIMTSVLCLSGGTSSLGPHSAQTGVVFSGHTQGFSGSHLLAQAPAGQRSGSELAADHETEEESKLEERVGERIEETLRELLEAMGVPEDSAKAHFVQANTYLLAADGMEDTNTYYKSLVHANLFIKKEPEQPLGYALRAWVAYSLACPALMIEDIERASTLRYEGTDREILFMSQLYPLLGQAVIALYQENPESAHDFLDQVDKIPYAAEDELSNDFRAMALLWQGNHDDALAEVQTSQTDSRLIRIAIHLAMDNNEEALAELNRVAEMRDRKLGRGIGWRRVNRIMKLIPNAEELEAVFDGFFPPDAKEFDEEEECARLLSIKESEFWNGGDETQ